MLAPFFCTSAPVESPTCVSTHDHTDSDLNKGPWESLGTESQDFSLGKIRRDKQSTALDGILTSVWSRCRVWMYWPTDSVSAPEPPPRGPCPTRSASGPANGCEKRPGRREFLVDSGPFIFLKCKEKLRPREVWLPGRISFKKDDHVAELWV